MEVFLSVTTRCKYGIYVVLYESKKFDWDLRHLSSETWQRNVIIGVYWNIFSRHPTWGQFNGCDVLGIFWAKDDDGTSHYVRSWLFFFTSGTWSVFAVMFASPLTLVSKMLLLIFDSVNWGLPFFTIFVESTTCTVFYLENIKAFSLPSDWIFRQTFVHLELQQYVLRMVVNQRL